MKTRCQWRLCRKSFLIKNTLNIPVKIHNTLLTHTWTCTFKQSFAALWRHKMPLFILYQTTGRKLTRVEIPPNSQSWYPIYCQHWAVIPGQIGFPQQVGQNPPVLTDPTLANSHNQIPRSDGMCRICQPWKQSTNNTKMHNTEKK